MHLIDRLAQGNPFAWIFFFATFIALGIALVYDLKTNKKNYSCKRREEPARLPVPPDSNRDIAQ